MTKKSRNGLIAVAVGVAVMAAGIFFLVIQPNTISGKEDAIKYLLSRGKSDESSLRGFGADYVTAWASALSKNEPTFKIANKFYSSQSGREMGAL